MSRASSSIAVRITSRSVISEILFFRPWSALNNLTKLFSGERNTSIRVGKVGNFHYHLDLEFFIFYLTLWNLVFLMVKMKMRNFCHSWTSANGHVPLHHGHNFGLENSTLFCERFEPMSHFKSKLSLIIRVNVVLNRTVFVDSDWHFDNLYGSHLQSQKHRSLSTKTVLFRTTFTRTITLYLLLSTLFIESCYSLFMTHTATSTEWQQPLK